MTAPATPSGPGPASRGDADALSLAALLDRAGREMADAARLTEQLQAVVGDALGDRPALPDTATMALQELDRLFQFQADLGNLLIVLARDPRTACPVDPGAISPELRLVEARQRLGLEQSVQPVPARGAGRGELSLF